MRKVITSLLFICFFVFCNAQIDFNNFTTVQSKGDIPSDFTTETFQKINQNLQNKRTEVGNQIDQRKFQVQTNYPIDNILHSGLVVFGDEISVFVSKTADQLLKNNLELRNKLRFYTIKSTISNAFSTDQGIIFVTTGLISQLSSEAQLAYILAHEISHYTEHHVVDAFVWKKDQKFDREFINKMNVYSKDKEFEADRLAINLYQEAGYSKEEILTTFDLLLYSHLPFDEVNISLDYFQSDLMYLPPHLFPTEEFPIKVDENEDDENSSHPNNKKRKTAVFEKISELNTSWGSTLFFQMEKDFYFVRNIARFEAVRGFILNAEYGSAIYAIYLLEKEFPTSLYLKKMKAQAWLGIYQYSKSNDIHSVIKTKSEFEGYSAKVHYLIDELDKKELTTFCIRNIYDLYKSNQADIEISAIYKFLIKELSGDELFAIKNYSSMTYKKALELSLLPEDTVSSKVFEEVSKYSKIKSKLSSDNLSKTVDSTNFYLYGISDVIKDSLFLSLLGENRKLMDLEKNAKERYNNLSAKEQKKFQKKNQYEQFKLGISEIIIVEPKVISYSKSGVDNVKSELLEENFSDAISESAQSANIIAHQIDNRTIKTNGTVCFNERNVLISSLIQVGENTGIHSFPVDFTLLKELSKTYNTSKAMYTVVDHTFDPDIKWRYVFVSLYLAPTAPFFIPVYVPSKIMTGNKTNLTVIMLDIETGSVLTGNSFHYNDPISKHTLGARLYTIFKHLNSSTNRL